MATYNSSDITRTALARGPGVYGVTYNGTINFVAANSLAVADVINICYIPFGSYLAHFNAYTPALDNGGTPSMNMGVTDSLAAPTTYVATSTNKGTHYSLAASFTDADILTTTAFGTQYGATARALGATGPAVVVWVAGCTLKFVLGTVALNTVGATVNIIYQATFMPCYDMGA